MTVDMHMQVRIRPHLEIGFHSMDSGDHKSNSTDRYDTVSRNILSQSMHALSIRFSNNGGELFSVNVTDFEMDLLEVYSCTLHYMHGDSVNGLYSLVVN